MRICGVPKMPISLSRSKVHHKFTINIRTLNIWALHSLKLSFWDLIFCPIFSMVQNTLFPYNTFSLICYREYQQLCFRTWDSCMMVHQHIFRLRCVTTYMLQLSGRWFERGRIPSNILNEGNFAWPARSLDLNRLDSFFWSFLKLLI